MCCISHCDGVVLPLYLCQIVGTYMFYTAYSGVMVVCSTNIFGHSQCGFDMGITYIHLELRH